ncbi:MAG TPA: hypothetical protein VMI10_24510 [Terriglobales bacterium]|nr:hypothetical protein [Terriglobales bacterium]
MIRKSSTARGDIIWAAALGAVACVLIWPPSRTSFLDATRAHPYLMGFSKFAVLATLGELLGLRIRMGTWKRPAGLLYRVIVWGFLGSSLVLVFQTFNGGVNSAINAGLLPSVDGRWRSIATAFWISAVMNLTFAPTMMAAHRVADAYIELRAMQRGPIALADVVSEIDWNSFFGFVVAKMIPLFWIPAHTLTFLLPPEYRVLMAAVLSIALGAILAFAARSETSSTASRAAHISIP